MSVIRTHQKRRFLDLARRMYSWGYSRQNISRRLGVSTGTLYRWEVEEEKAGLDWESLREANRRFNRRVLIVTLERRLQEAADDDGLTPAARADVVCKLALALQAERENRRRVPRVVTYEVAAKLFGCSVSTLRRYVRSGRLRRVSTGRRLANRHRERGIGLASILKFLKGGSGA